MVFPLYDDNTGGRTFPYANYVLIALNVLVFVFLQRGGEDFHSEEGERFTYAFSCVPEEIVTGKDVTDTLVIHHPVTEQELGRIKLERTPISVYLTLLTS